MKMGQGLEWEGGSLSLDGWKLAERSLTDHYQIHPEHPLWPIGYEASNREPDRPGSHPNGIYIRVNEKLILVITQLFNYNW